MKLSTVVELSENKIFSHKNKYILFGSCFAENIAERLSYFQFDGVNNPFGILFNPISIANSIDMILDKRLFAEKDLFNYNGLWHSDFHHGSFSHKDLDYVLKNINDNISMACRYILQSDFLFLTFGSSWVYKRNDIVVANCHKLPAKQFVRHRLTVDEIVGRYTQIFARLFELNPRIKVVLSVSPIRYLRDGAFDNSVNKSILLMSVYRLIESFPDIIYFPAYEILLDELRDYRFYSEDLVHPANIAKTIIWEKFSCNFLTDNTLLALKDIDRLRKMFSHDIMHTESKEVIAMENRKQELRAKVEHYLNENNVLKVEW